MNRQEVLRLLIDYIQTAQFMPLEKMRKMILSLMYSQENARLLSKYWEEYEIQGPRHVHLDNVTRWSSTAKMLKDFIRLKGPITHIIKKLSTKVFRNKNLLLTEEEWLLLTETSNLFNIFIEATNFLQGQNYSIIQYVLPFISKIRNDLIKIIESDQTPAVFKGPIRKGLEKLSKYFPNMLSTTGADKYSNYFLALILDPRSKIKGIVFLDSQQKIDLEQVLKNICYHMYKYIYEKSPTRETRSSFNPLIETDELSDFTDDESETDEIYIYLHEKRASRRTDLLSWWRDNQKRLPILAKIASNYLAIMATSAAAESQFSTSGNFITRNRFSLTNDTVKKVMLLKGWCDEDFMQPIPEEDIDENKSEDLFFDEQRVKDNVKGKGVEVFSTENIDGDN